MIAADRYAQARCSGHQRKDEDLPKETGIAGEPAERAIATNAIWGSPPRSPSGRLEDLETDRRPKNEQDMTNTNHGNRYSRRAPTSTRDGSPSINRDGNVTNRLPGSYLKAIPGERDPGEHLDERVATSGAIRLPPAREQQLMAASAPRRGSATWFRSSGNSNACRPVRRTAGCFQYNPPSVFNTHSYWDAGRRAHSGGVGQATSQSM
jgi:hypothetical protein